MNSLGLQLFCTLCCLIIWYHFGQASYVSNSRYFIQPFCSNSKTKLHLTFTRNVALKNIRFLSLIIFLLFKFVGLSRSLIDAKSHLLLRMLALFELFWFYSYWFQWLTRSSFSNRLSEFLGSGSICCTFCCLIA